ncbi:hypothetical protein SPRG_00364 [Saprolegnia parasitica CBS 223.65]|uniref:PH domain-containing protein n=1 Tax=Saprolegnia parasitica (strain CBS 223.65) TaxID=695850 RepID=A0A067D933_SAPPC|nr:hypothetical protein SPRG_00364 [Saprolegnia parasitica CBS 223.65]KDO35517.1 hypothetical protein SPRG_00364 [Saprolegnia parasitica CBS 223.65]|eukprot:XP_012193853.1 hypothetical protein SPRG_00364 [Saprolegnia parasitica CBS 223.65]
MERSTSLARSYPQEFRLVNADFAGYAYRLSKKWKRRFFVLEGRRLSYFGSEDDANDSGRAPKGTITVCAAYHWSDVNNGLILVSSSGDLWKCYVEMTNAGEMILPALTRVAEHCRAVADGRATSGDVPPAAEVTAIRQFCNARATAEFKLKHFCVPLRSDAKVTRGWVEKRGAVMRTWKRRYFVLRENVLAYYDINLEGQPKKGGDFVQSIETSTIKPNGLEFKMVSGRSLLGFTETTDDHVQWLLAANTLHHEP